MAFFIGVGADRAALSARMQTIWTSFAHHGDPSAEGFVWPSHDPVERATVAIDHALTALRPAWAREVGAWSPSWRALFPVEGIDTARVAGSRSTPPPQMPLEQFASPTVEVTCVPGTASNPCSSARLHDGHENVR